MLLGNNPPGEHLGRTYKTNNWIQWWLPSAVCLPLAGPSVFSAVGKSLHALCLFGLVG